MNNLILYAEGCSLYAKGFYAEGCTLYADGSYAEGSLPAEGSLYAEGSLGITLLVVFVALGLGKILTGVAIWKFWKNKDKNK